jgi:hypothetical protein
MKRREFLVRAAEAAGSTVVGSVILTVGVGGSISGCASDDDSSGSGETPQGSRTFAVDPSAGHIHDVVIPNSILAAPPESGFNGSTTNDSGHSHSISLTQAGLTNIQAAMLTSGMTGRTDSHTHTFTFS